MNNRKEEMNFNGWRIGVEIDVDFDFLAGLSD
jgi:hypothetical protein